MSSTDRKKRIGSLLLVGTLFLLIGCSQLIDPLHPPDTAKLDNPSNEEGILPSNGEDSISTGELSNTEGENIPIEPEEPPKPTGETKVKIRVVGDIMVHMHQLKAAKEADGTYDFTEVFEDIKPYMDEADIAMGNFETTISNDEIGYTAYPRFRTPESILSALKGAGFDVLTTANNHSLDGVGFGVTNTLDKLDEYGFSHTGTARSPEERDEVLIIDKNDIKIGVLAYTYGTNGMEGAMSEEELSYMVNYLHDKEKIERDIGKAKEEGAEFIVACIHWGDEYVREPNESQKQMADELFAMGIDVIFGSHPHVIQPMERRTFTTPEGEDKEGFVIYSLGNIVSNQRDRYRDSGVILDMEVIKDYDEDTIRLGDIDYVPTWVYRFTKGERLHYRILPVEDFMDEAIEASAGVRLKEVWKETTEHLGGKE